MKPYLPFLTAIIVTLPGIVIRLAGIHLDAPSMALIAGSAILAASFLLLWACDAAQMDIPQTLALAVVALIAVLPEYAVDMYFTWQAGKNPDSNYAQFAIANMTGANRLLIGVAWGMIALICWARHGRVVRIGEERRLELFFLGAASAYAFVLPFKGTLAWYDGIVFLGLYVLFIILASKRPCEEVEMVGPAAVIARLPTIRRRMVTGLLFLFSAGAILANAEPFCEGLINTGKAFQINEFLLVQWLAPIASEAPEFVVALVFAWRGQASMALGSLLSAKLNQWTLLVGMIPAVYALSHQSLSHPIPMGHFQMQEILLTATQSLLAVVLLASMRLSLGGAFLLFCLFAGQLMGPTVVKAFPVMWIGLGTEQIHSFFSMLYIMATLTLFLRHPGQLPGLYASLRTEFFIRK